MQAIDHLASLVLGFKVVLDLFVLLICQINNHPERVVEFSEIAVDYLLHYLLRIHQLDKIHFLASSTIGIITHAIAEIYHNLLLYEIFIAAT